MKGQDWVHKSKFHSQTVLLDFCAPFDPDSILFALFCCLFCSWGYYYHHYNYLCLRLIRSFEWAVFPEHYVPLNNVSASNSYNSDNNLMYVLSTYQNGINLITFYSAYWGCATPYSGCLTDTSFVSHKWIASVTAISRLWIIGCTGEVHWSINGVSKAAAIYKTMSVAQYCNRLYRIIHVNSGKDILTGIICISSYTNIQSKQSHQGIWL